MAYNFVSASTQSFSDTTFTPPASAPFSYAISGRPTNVSVRKSILCYFNNNTPSPNNGALELNGVSFGSNKAYANSTAANTSSTVVSSSTFTTSAWLNYSIGIPAAGVSPMTIYSGATKTTDAANSSGLPTGLDRLTLGRQTSGTANAYNQYYDGDIARVAFWSGVILSDRERLSIAADFSPRRVRPQSLSTYRHLINSGNDMTSRAASLVATGSPTLTRHPRSYGM